jgi:hypothetical protein
MIKVKHRRARPTRGRRFSLQGRQISRRIALWLRCRAAVHHVGGPRRSLRRSLAQELAPLRINALEHHPWREWAEAGGGEPTTRMPGGQSRWSAGKDLSWEPLRIERVCEVKYDHMQGDRFRHGTTFLRWRPDKPPAGCRYDQLEVTAPYEIEKVFGTGSGRGQ